MDNNGFKEVFSQTELDKLNEELKKTENTNFPESLSKDNIIGKINGISQESFEKSAENKRKNKKMWLKVASLAAVFAVVFSSLMIIKPWRNKAVINPVNNTEKPLQTAEDYSEIENMFSEYYKNYKNSQNRLRLFSYGTKNAVADEVAPADTASGLTAESNAEGSVNKTAAAYNSHGKTNEQVNGVSEADILKNDGRYLYINESTEPDWWGYYDETGYVKNNGIVNYSCKIAIIEQKENGKLQKVSDINILPPENSEISYMYVNEFFVTGDTLTVVLTGNVELPKNEEKAENQSDGVYRGGWYGNFKNVTVAVTYDIKDRSNPRKTDSVVQDGGYLSSRMIGEKLVLISDYYVNLGYETGDITKNCIPKTAVNGKAAERISVDDICIMDKVCNTEYLVASVMNSNNMSETYKVQAVLGGGQNIYCNTENLYVTDSIYSYSGSDFDTVKEIFGIDKDDLSYTQLYRFSVSGDDVKYSGKATVVGTALNQFSIDEYNGNLRIATTTGFWGDSLENFVTVLDKDLNKVGFLDKIAKGETIKSVRFSGDTGYVVTFEQTDPLFVIDLSNPKVPAVTGEVKIPGFSNYLHPVSNTLLLGVGVDGDENGAGNGLKVSLFDVSDPASPKEASRYIISTKEECDENGKTTSEYVNSEAFYNHKAVCYDEENKTMYIPFEKFTNIYEVNGDFYNKTELGSLAVKVNESTKTVEPVNTFTQEKSTDDGYYVCNRVTFTGNTVYNIFGANNTVSSFNLDTAQKYGEFSFADLSNKAQNENQ